MTNEITDKFDETDVATRRRVQILDAAADCFRHNGFHRSSLAQISAAAGMSTGHIYHYFRSKEEIIAAIVARERDETDLLIEEAKSAGSDADVVSLFIDRLARSAALYRDTSRASLMMEILAEAARNPEIAKVVQHDNEGFHQALCELFKESGPRTRSRMEIVGALMAGLSVRALRNPRLNEDLDLDMLRAVVRFVLAA